MLCLHFVLLELYPNLVSIQFLCLFLPADTAVDGMPFVQVTNYHRILRRQALDALTIPAIQSFMFHNLTRLVAVQ